MLANIIRQREAIAAEIRETLPPPRRRLFEVILRRAQGYATAHENIVFHLQKAWPVFRAGLLEIGRRLADAGTLARPDDVFFLKKIEVWDGWDGCRGGRLDASLSLRAAERRCVWIEQNALEPPTSIPSPEDPAWEKAMTWPVDLRRSGFRLVGAERVLVGTAASPGRIRARARVLGFPAEFERLERGDVLVTVATTPVWTPLFSRVAAVVTDVGGMASHSSIVAREYRIPAVVGTRQGSRVIRDGQIVTVDGTQGKVYL